MSFPGTDLTVSKECSPESNHKTGVQQTKLLAVVPLPFPSLLFSFRFVFVNAPKRPPAFVDILLRSPLLPPLLYIYSPIHIYTRGIETPIHEGHIFYRLALFCPCYDILSFQLVVMVPVPLQTEQQRDPPGRQAKKRASERAISNPAACYG